MEGRLFRTVKSIVRTEVSEYLGDIIEWLEKGASNWNLLFQRNRARGHFASGLTLPLYRLTGSHIFYQTRYSSRPCSLWAPRKPYLLFNSLDSNKADLVVLHRLTGVCQWVGLGNNSFVRVSELAQDMGMGRFVPYPR